MLTAACSASQPAAPTLPSSAGLATGDSSAAVHGTTVSALDGQPIGGLTVRVGSRTATTDAGGAFQFQNLAEGVQSVIVTGPGFVDRQTTVTIPTTDTLRESLIPASFDLAAFDQMFRGTGRLQRWDHSPALVVLTRTMQYETFGAGDEYHATAEALTSAEIDLLVQHLSEGLALLTGNTFTAFSSIELESPQAGDKVSTARAGKIVVGRFKGVQNLANTIGFGRWATDASGAVAAGAIFLDRDFDRASDQRRLLRIHELGHTLGYQHVTVRSSVMNPTIGPEPSVFDRQGATVAFQRPVGNASPDNDLDVVLPVSGGIFGVRVIGPLYWSTRIEY